MDPPVTSEPNLQNSSLSSQTSNSGNSLTEEEPDVPIDHQSSKGVFGWCEINGVMLPTILRQGNKTFLSVRMVELKLMGHIRAEIAKLRVENPVVSHYVTEAECNLLNEINFKHCDKEYGEAAFATQDLIVDKEHFEKFFHYLLDRIRESGGVVPVMTASAVAPPAPAVAAAAATAPDVKPNFSNHPPNQPTHPAPGVLHHLAQPHLRQPHPHQPHPAVTAASANSANKQVSYARQVEAKKSKQLQMLMQKQAQQQRLVLQQREKQLQQQQQTRLVTPSSAAALLQLTKQQHQVAAGSPAAQRQMPVTGWIQLNNTMVPFVVRGNDRFLPVEIVCGAAQLLGHVQDRRTISQPANNEELLVLNEACQRERIDFTFSSNTCLVSLALVQRMTKAVGAALSVVDRPAVNPFGHARGAAAATAPVNHAQIQQNSNAFHGQQPVILPNQPNRPPLDFNAQRPRLQPTVSAVPSSVQQRPGANKNVVTTATIRQSLSAVLQQQTNGLLNKNNVPWGRQPTANPFGMSPTNTSHPLLQHQQQQPPRQMSPSAATRAPNNPFGSPVVLFKVYKIAEKEVLFAVTNNQPDGVALVHDISRRLFSHADEDELIYAMTSVLRVPLLDLTPEISTAFATRDPAYLPPKAKTNKLIRKSVLDEFYQRLSYMFPTANSNPGAPAAASRSAASSLSQSNLSKQPTMTLKQIAQQLNAHAASVGVSPQNGSLGSISPAGSASAVLRKHIEAQKSAVANSNQVPNAQHHNSSVVGPHQHLNLPAAQPQQLHPLIAHPQQPNSTASSESLVKTEKTDTIRTDKPAQSADPIILSDSEDEEAQPSNHVTAASKKMKTTTTTIITAPINSQPANASTSASSALNMSDTDNGVDLWKESAEDEAAVNFVLAENPEIVQDDVLKLAFALSPPPPPPPTPPASEPDFPTSSAEEEKVQGLTTSINVNPPTGAAPGVGKKLAKTTTTYGKRIDTKGKNGDSKVKKKRGRKPKKKDKEKASSKHGVDPDAEYAKMVQMEEANVFEDSSSSSSSAPSTDDEEWSPGKKVRIHEKVKRARVRQSDDESSDGDDDKLDKRKKGNDDDDDDDEEEEIVKKKKRKLKINEDDDGDNDRESDGDDDGERQRARRKNGGVGTKGDDDEDYDEDDYMVAKWRKRAKPASLDEFLLDGDESDASSASSASSSSSSSSDWGEMGLTLLDERDRQRLSSTGSQERRRAVSGADSSSQDVPYSGSSRVTFGPDHWSVLASVDARLEERRNLAELYRRYEVSCQLKPCRVKLKRVAIQKPKSRRGRRPSKLTTTTVKSKTKMKTLKEIKPKDGERRKRLLVAPTTASPSSVIPSKESSSALDQDSVNTKRSSPERTDEPKANEEEEEEREEKEELLLVQKGGSDSLTRLTIVTNQM